MKFKLFWLYLSKFYSAICLVFISLLFFPKIAALYLTLPNEAAMAIYFSIFAIAFLLCISSLFMWLKKMPVSDLISPLVFLLVLFPSSWMALIYLGYDTTSKNPIFVIAGILSLIITAVLAVKWFKNINNIDIGKA